MKNFSGNILFLDRSDINTDEIIPARYLNELTKEALKPFLLEDLKLNGFNPARDIKGKSAIITRNNFGCGSSREHAPWALEMNGINLAIAIDFARIYRQNMYNCGMLAVELPMETIDSLFAKYAGKSAVIETDLKKSAFTIRSEGDTDIIPFEISGYDRALIEAGGWVEYADSKY